MFGFLYYYFLGNGELFHAYQQGNILCTYLHNACMVLVFGQYTCDMAYILYLLYWHCHPLYQYQVSLPLSSIIPICENWF